MHADRQIEEVLAPNATQPDVRGEPPTASEKTVELPIGTESPDLEEERVRALVRDRLLGDEPADGMRIGRFRVIEQLGAGGMGVVYLAEDPELGRKIALKLLHSQGAGASAETAARLMREAQAMARVVHPNLATIYDVGRHDGRVFIAMEYIEGSTLREWLKNDDRDWEEIIEVFLGAGRGLAAAHDAGFVHRDFKPDNVLVGRGGVAKVVDFGLARSLGEFENTDPDIDPDESTIADAMQPLPRLTQTGIVVGTPAYMAPEQHLGETSDARTDVFAFSVALWEALYGTRPFLGKTRRALMLNVMQGDISEPAFHAPGLPAAVETVLRSGLRHPAAERTGSMAELLDSLERAAGRRERLDRRGAAWPAFVLLPTAALVLWAWMVRVSVSLERVPFVFVDYPLSVADLVASNAVIAGVAIGAGVLVGADARRLGFGRDPRHPRATRRVRPFFWIVGTLFMWPLVYPLYLLVRERGADDVKRIAWAAAPLAVLAAVLTAAFQLEVRGWLDAKESVSSALAVRGAPGRSLASGDAEVSADRGGPAGTSDSDEWVDVAMRLQQAGAAAYSVGDLERAIHDWERGLALASENGTSVDDVVRAVFILNLASAHTKAFDTGLEPGRLGTARALYQRLLDEAESGIYYDAETVASAARGLADVKQRIRGLSQEDQQRALTVVLQDLPPPPRRDPDGDAMLEVARAHLTIARVHAAVGLHEHALASYRSSLEPLRNWNDPNMRLRSSIRLEVARLFLDWHAAEGEATRLRTAAQLYESLLEEAGRGAPHDEATLDGARRGLSLVAERMQADGTGTASDP